ncbi:uncharacterized protein LOC121239391 [Juglans microcarpa x Juglans regia]|uniref:uncharacterized protein LOC121239391 n=1 Tax=Juglans microcarpa x Juglans regia TaxID=2249226 RepID=UPI001B7EA080|nr:uncharacterized protein LOC121239391 [Juglans microcarpa x Juglans regia]
MGLECEGYEDQFLAILTAIKAEHKKHWKNVSKKQRELNKLTWSLDTEGSSSRDMYGPNLDSTRVCLWEELVGIHSWWNVPWCIGGDFNVTRVPSESSGTRRGRPAMIEFSQCISDLNLVDFPLAGGSATWANNKTWSRLDRFLISPDWESHFPDVWQKRLPRISSDHWPILLDCGGIRGKLKALKRDLKLWNVQSLSDLGANKKGKLTEVQEIERIQEARSLTQDEVARKLLLGEELERIILLEEISWRQK